MNTVDQKLDDDYLVSNYMHTIERVACVLKMHLSNHVYLLLLKVTQFKPCRSSVEAAGPRI